MVKASILQQLMKELKVNVYQFEKEIGVSQSRIDKAIKRDSKLNLDIVELIATRYPNVNREWLKTGDGNMLTSKKKASGKQVAETEKGFRKAATKVDIETVRNIFKENDADAYSFADRVNYEEMGKRYAEFVRMIDNTPLTRVLFDFEERIRRLEKE